MLNSEFLEFPETTARVATLDNGLEIIIKEDHSAPVVSLQAWCRAGSIHEGGWLGAGMSHFLEHMLFKGTERRSANEIAQAVQREGGYINAYTSFDRTVYWIDTPSAGFENCLDVLCDVVAFARLPEDEFASEADVIRREIAMGDDDPEAFLGKALFRTAYTNHPCRYPVIGFLDLFNQLSRDDLYGYYLEKYSPDNLFIVVAGDVDADQTVEWIESHLGGISRRRRPLVVLPEEPRHIGIREELVPFQTELVRGRLGWPIPSGDHPDGPSLDILAAILGNGKSSRLYREVRENQQLVNSVGAYSYAPTFQGQFVLSYDTEPSNSKSADEAILGEIDKVKSDGVTLDEVNKVVRQALSSQFSTLTDMRGQASDLGSNWITTRNLNYTRDYVKDLQRVMAEDVVRAANQYLADDRYTRVSLVPQVETSPVKSSLGKERSEDIRRLQLENGLTVLLLSDRRVPFVYANGIFRGGVLAEDLSKNGVTRLMSRLLAKDTENYSAESVVTQIESVGGGISSSVGNNSFGVTAYGLRPDVGLAVDLLGDALTKPVFLDEAVEREKQFQIAQIKAEADRPFSVAMRELRRQVFGNHPYSMSLSGSDESVSQLDRDSVIQLRKRLVKGGNGVLALFGDIDLGEAEDLICGRFENDIPRGEREFLKPLEFSYPSGEDRVVRLAHEKEQAVILVGYRTVSLDHGDNIALDLIEEACSDMASRMFIRIREELGLAYSVGATRMQGLEPGMIIFYASTAPEKLDLVEEEMLKEIKLIADEGLIEEEFDRAKASWLGKEVIHLQGARELAGSASVDELVGLGWDHYRKAPGEIDAVSREEVQEVAARYLSSSNRVIVRLTNPEIN